MINLVRGRKYYVDSIGFRLSYVVEPGTFPTQSAVSILLSSIAVSSVNTAVVLRTAAAAASAASAAASAASAAVVALPGK